MRKSRKQLFSFVVAVLMVLPICLTILPTQAEAVNDAVRDARDGIVRMGQITMLGDREFCQSTGTGFCVGKPSSDMYVVTNRHVVDARGDYGLTYAIMYYAEETGIKIETDEDLYEHPDFWDYFDTYNSLAWSRVFVIADGREYEISPGDIMMSSKTDLAVIHLRADLSERKKLSLRKSDRINQTDEVTAIGYPGAADLNGKITSDVDNVTFTDGMVSKVDFYLGARVIQHTADIRGGNSGGPLVNENGLVIGVNTWGLGIDRLTIGETAINGAIHLEELKSFLDQSGVPYTEKKDRINSNVVLIAATIFLATAAAASLIWYKSRDSFPAVLKKIADSSDTVRLLSNPNYFLAELSKNYRKKYKTDCMLLERAANDGVGSIFLQFLQQNNKPSPSDRKKLIEGLCNNCGFAVHDASRVVDLYTAMLGFDGKTVQADTMSNAGSGGTGRPQTGRSDRGTGGQNQKSTIGPALRNLYLSSDQTRMLTDTDYFIQRLTQVYKPEYKQDCQLLDRASHSGVGMIVIQFVQQNATPSASDLNRLVSELCNRAGFSPAEARRAVSLYSAMVGWKLAGWNTR